MELEFDKEIDALLRKAQVTGGVTTAGDHLDADAINAFAENAVPASLRAVYTRHFADCDRCRGLLSQTALLHEPLSAKAMTAAAAPAQAAPWPPPEKSAPWYRSLFRAPGLAAAMGVLVLAFGAGLIYLVTQRKASDSVAMAPSAATSNTAIPYSGIETNATSNAAASNSNAAISAANTAAAASRSANTTSNSAAAGENAPAPSGAGTATGLGSAGSTSGGAPVPPPAAAAQPPASSADTVASEKAEPPKTAPGAREDKDEKEAGRSRAVTDDRLARDAALSKKSTGGPLRGAGPVQGNVQSNVQAYEMPVTRKVGGKTFRNSGGAWYDSAYHGQSTTNVHRNTDDYKKLDSGLRSIANELGGVVVVVWKDKAYRID